ESDEGLGEGDGDVSEWVAEKPLLAPPSGCGFRFETLTPGTPKTCTRGQFSCTPPACAAWRAARKLATGGAFCATPGVTRHAGECTPEEVRGSRKPAGEACFMARAYTPGLTVSVRTRYHT